MSRRLVMQGRWGGQSCEPGTYLLRGPPVHHRSCLLSHSLEVPCETQQHPCLPLLKTVLTLPTKTIWAHGPRLFGLSLLFTPHLKSKCLMCIYHLQSGVCLQESPQTIILIEILLLVQEPSTIWNFIEPCMGNVK